MFGGEVLAPLAGRCAGRLSWGATLWRGPVTTPGHPACYRKRREPGERKLCRIRDRGTAVRAARARAPARVARVADARTCRSGRTGSSRLLERELLVRHRLERHPVQGRDAELLDRGAVLGRRVADVGGELPARVALLHPVHEAVARDLGDHGGGGDRGRGGVAADDVALLEARRRDGEAVGQADAAVDARRGAACPTARRGWSCAGRARRCRARSGR